MSFDPNFDGTISFGNVKPLPKLPEGDYQCKITDWELVQPQNIETREKGMNLRVKFKLSDAVQEIDGVEHDLSNMTFSCNIFFMFNNPFSLVPLLSAVKGLDKEDPEVGQKLGNVDITDKSDWLGEEVVVRLVRTEDKKTGKSYLNPVPELFTPVQF